MKILYITSRLPVPPLVKGDTLRDFNLIKALADKGHEITLISYYRGNENTSLNLPVLRNNLKDLKLIKFNSKVFALNLYKGLYSLLPFQVILYNSKKFKDTIKNEVNTGNYDIAYIHFARLAEFIKDLDITKVVDLQDSFEKNMKDRYKKEKNLLLKYVALFESFKMKRYEERLTKEFDLCTVVSERDIQHYHKRIHIIPNGVQDITKSKKEDTEDNIVFWGNMGYFPNQDAAKYLVKEIMPKVWKEKPDIHVYIVGSNPSSDIKSLASDKVTVTGFVPNLQPYIDKATIVVAPLRYATGVQNKVLEAMKAGIPQVLTRNAVEGLHDFNGDEVLTSRNNPESIAKDILKLLKDKELQKELSEKSIQYIQKYYSWKKSAEILEEEINNILKQKIKVRQKVRIKGH